MTTHFRPPFPGLSYRRTAIAAAGAASVVAALALGGYSLAHNLDYLHQGFAWTCANLPMADPGALADSFFGGVGDKLVTMARDLNCFSSEITGAASQGAAGITQATRNFFAPAIDTFGEGAQLGKEVAASARGSLAQGFSALSASTRRQVTELMTMSPAELAAEAKQLAVYAMQLFLAVKSIHVGYKSATSWLRRKLGRSPAMAPVAQKIHAAPAAAANVTINLTIAAGSSPEAADRLREKISERVQPKDGREQGGVEVIDAVMDAVDEAGSLTEGLREQLEQARATALQLAGDTVIRAAGAENLEGDSARCENQMEEAYDVEVNL